MRRSLRNLPTIAWSLAFTLALTYFWVRGPARALAPDGNLDFEVVYNGIQTFQEGHNPYLTEDVLKVAEAHDRQYSIRHYANARLLYAPGFLSLFDPIARLDYRTATAVWMGLQVAAFAALLVVAIALARIDGESRKAFVLWGLCFAPIHTNFAHGQPGIFFCLLTLLFFWSLTGRRDWPAALAFGLLLAKPSFAVPAALVALARGRWRAVLLGCVVGVVTWLPFLSRYGLQNAVTHYATAVHAVQAPGGDADDAQSNPRRFDLVNLRSWLGSWSTPTPVRDGLYWLAMVLAALVLFRARHVPDASELYWTFAAVFCALALYHRFYDATVVIVGCAAVFAQWERDRKIALAMTVCLLPFAVPGTAFLVQLFGATHPAWIEATLIRHQALALIGLAVVTAYGLLRNPAKAQALTTGE